MALGAKLFWAGLLLAGLAVLSFGQVPPVPVDIAALAKSHLKASKEDGSITNLIEELVRSGEFCRIRGHSWGEHMHITMEYSPNRIGCRECKVCRLHQSQYATEWK